jgi:translation initiation factor IF-3
LKGGKDKKIFQPKINEAIEAEEIRVIDEEGKNLGIMEREKALLLAKEKGLDLIEISPHATPPVAKIIKFDKWRYQKEKEEKELLKKQKAKGLKQVQISPRTAEGDLLIKARQINKFLEDGHKVEINLKLKGRENINQEWALKKLEEFMKMITVPYTITMDIKKGGKGYITQITKK